MATGEDQNKESDVLDNLFRDVKYYLIGSIPQKIEGLLQRGGGKKDPYLSEMITHVIADDVTEDDYQEAKELFELPVVSSQWVLMSVKCKRLLSAAAFNPERSQIFSKMVVCASQLSAHDCHSLWTQITQHGGKCKRVLDSTVTHLVCGKAAGAKYDTALRHPLRLKVVCPDWVTQSIAQGSCLPEDNFHPRLLVAETEAMETDQSEEPARAVTPLPTSPPTTPSAIGPPLLLQGSPKGESTRAKEVLAKMVSSRIQQATAKFRETFDYAPPLEPDPEPDPPVENIPEAIIPTTPLAPDMPVILPVDVPVVRARGRGRGSRGPRGPRGSRGGLQRTMLQNITNKGEIPIAGMTRSPRGRRSPRSPRGMRGARKLNQMVPTSPGMMPFSLFPGGYQAKTQPDVPMYYGHDPSETVPEDLCLLGCVFYITDYQKLVDSPQFEAWVKVIKENGGQVDDSYSNRVTHLLCEHQCSDVFRLALRDGKRLVTAYWLNDVLLRHKLSPPWMAVHFPLIFGKAIPEKLKEELFCVTNFEGEERERVKHMILMLGAKYTSYMGRGHSALIAKKQGGRKYDKALEWRLPVVNIHFLNDILLGDLRALKLPLQAKYQQFSASTDGFPVETWKVAHLLEGWRIPIKISKEAWKRVTPNLIVKLPVPGGPNTHESTLFNPSSPGRASSPAHHQSTPGTPGRPNTPGRPGSAHSSNPGTPHRPTTPGHKRAMDGEGNGGKKIKYGEKEYPIVHFVSLFLYRVESDASAIPQSRMLAPSVLITGMVFSQAKAIRADIEGLGGRVVTSSSEATHMVCPQVMRTVKFLTALSMVQHIVSPAWVHCSTKQGHFVDETYFPLTDEINEHKYNFKLSESLHRARLRKVFQGLFFHVTPSVAPGVSVLKAVIENAGGQLVSKRPPTKHMATARNPLGNPIYVVITCEADKQLCQGLFRHNIEIHSAEFVLSGVMRQDIDFHTYRIER
ncbi:hypothetical protein CAPTEDRAFT_224833 [Capitella teleta]|uniref:PAX-interacting protein 1 n=1 Tax=Capitella teleta TaxID=283909 RepID=R7U653_CAPTE|nr:hypothetical protein CAPTEDRAFT_224833 [Capitella teleta]|eukprot:ELU01586.1 hypothetical protein CAPTEDRAFT_224833 [Capitella teleta]